VDKGVYSALSGAVANEKSLESTANNIANIDTAGFKKDNPVFKEYLTKLEKVETVIDIPRAIFNPSDYYHLHGNERSYVSLDDIVTDFSQGRLKMTANPLDLAIIGDGFFEINTPLGIRFSKAGNFTLDSNQRLVTLDGNPVLSERTDNNEDFLRTPASTDIDEPSNREIIINNKNISVLADGTIMNGNQRIAKLSLVEFVEPNNSLIKAGSNLFASVENSLIKVKPTSSISQGYLEGSNVNPTSEMINLISTQRVFDGLNKAINTYSDMAVKANDLSDLSK